MIFDIQTLQMTIDSITNPDSIMMYYSTNDPIKAINEIKKDSSLDFDNYKDMMTEKAVGIEDFTGQKAYVMYIEECPDIIKQIGANNTNERITELNNELIEIYNKQIPLMKKVMTTLEQIKTTNMTDEEKTNAYNTLISFKEENLKYFSEFNQWNNKLRE